MKCNIKRFFLNIGLLGIYLALFDASIVFPGLSARAVYSPLAEVMLLLVPSVILTAICSGACKGYKTEFIDRYPKSTMITAVTLLLTWGGSLLWMLHCAGKQYGGVMPGMSALGDYVIMWLIWILLALAKAAKIKNTASTTPTPIWCCCAKMKPVTKT